MRPVRPSRLARISVALAVTGSLAALSACGSQDSTTTSSDANTASSAPVASPTTSSTQAASAASIDITIKDETTDPAGKRVQVKVGEPVTLNIDSDTTGELHVHSTPEQHIKFAAGKSTHEVKIDRPGLVDVEDHHLEKLIVQLEVR